MFCPNCGKEMNDDASFCSNCGWGKNSTKGFANKLKLKDDIKKSKNKCQILKYNVNTKFLELVIKKRIILGVCVIIVLLIFIMNTIFSKKDDLSMQIVNAKMVTEYSVETTVEEMDTVKFGSYPQSDGSGNIKEPIEWIVLDRQGNKTLLLSKYILDCKRYENSGNNTTWETCSLRNWLNSDFYNNAFNSNEQGKIQMTDVINNDNIDFGTSGGNNTQDNIFCLSIEEVRRYFGNGTKGYLGYYLGKNVATRGTYYAKNADNNFSKLWVGDSDAGEWCCGNSKFWLRSPGGNQYSATDVDVDGELCTFGHHVDSRIVDVGVRPALWISNLSSSNSKSKTQNSFFSNLFKKTGIVEENGAKYFYDDSGNKVVSNWKDVDGNWYYFDSDGKCVTNDWNKIDGAYYYFNEEGIMQKDKWIDNKYYVNANGKMLVNTITPDGYYVDAEGSYIENVCFTTKEVYALWESYESYKSKASDADNYDMLNWNKNKRMCNNQGDVKLIHNDSGPTAKSYFETSTCILTKSGIMYEAVCGEDYYMFEIRFYEYYTKNGLPISKQEFEAVDIGFDSKYVPVVLNNLNLSGWSLINNNYHYFVNGQMCKNQWIDGKYYVDSEGHMLINALTPDGYYVDYKGEYVKDINNTVIYLNGYYYLNGVMLTNAWINYRNNYYYVDANGIVEKNKWIENRYVGSSGAMYVGAMTPDGKYVNSDGYVVSDVNKDLTDSIKEKDVEGEAWYKTKAGLWYYFEKDRKTLRKSWFTDSRDNQTYYLDKNTGIMAVGWTEIDGSLYYFNESYENEPNWYEVRDGIYESFGKKVKSYGSMYKKEITPDGKQVDENGKLIGENR